MSYKDPTETEKRKIFDNSLVGPASSVIQKDGTQKTQVVDSSGNEIGGALKTALETLDNAISGSEMQVDIVSMPSVTITGTIVNTFSTRQDTYTGTGSGTTVNASTSPLNKFAIQVKGTGAAATVWDVRLEGSLDNVNFTQVLQHTTATGDGIVLYSGTTISPNLYFRSRCAELTLGGATNVVVTILGIP